MVPSSLDLWGRRDCVRFKARVLGSRDDARVANGTRRFPRWRLFWRFVRSTEQTLGSFPMVLLTPVVATAWAVSDPVTEFVRRGIVVSHASFWHVLLLAVAGGLGGIVAIAGITVLGAIVYYHAVGDHIWEATYLGHNGGQAGWGLRCRGDVPMSQTLGALECVVKTPSGTLLSTDGPEGDLSWRGNPDGVFASFAMAREVGVYEARWYASMGDWRGRMQEVARVRGESRDT
jgi:hypothetical protein